MIDKFPTGVNLNRINIRTDNQSSVYNQINAQNPTINALNKSKQKRQLKQINDSDDQQQDNIHSIINVENPTINTLNKSKQRCHLEQIKDPDDKRNVNKSNRRTKLEEKGKDNPDDQQHDNYHSDNNSLILNNQSIIDIENSTIEPLINSNQGIKFKVNENSDDKQDDNGHLVNVEYATIKPLVCTNRGIKSKREYVSDDKQDGNDLLINGEYSTIKPLVNSIKRNKSKVKEVPENQHNDNTHSVMNFVNTTIDPVIISNKTIKYEGKEDRVAQHDDNNCLINANRISINDMNSKMNIVNRSTRRNECKQINDADVLSEKNQCLSNSVQSIINIGNAAEKTLIHSKQRNKLKQNREVGEQQKNALYQAVRGNKLKRMNNLDDQPNENISSINTNQSIIVIDDSTMNTNNCVEWLLINISG